MRHAKRQSLNPDDVNNAFQVRNVEPIYGFLSGEPLRFKKVAGAPDLYYVDDTELDLNDIVTGPLPLCPRESTFTSHWLAIEGVQPTIPQNPPPNPDDDLALSMRPSKKRKGQLQSILLANQPTPQLPIPIDSSGAAAADSSQSPVVVKPLVKHVLSKELQIYFEKVTGAIKSTNGSFSKSLSESEESSAAVTSSRGDFPTDSDALRSLSRDPGLHQLLPYFTQFIADEVTHNLRKLPLLSALMRMVKALLSNPYLHIEPYLHQLMPAVLTCLVGKRLCQSPNENHWALRDYSAGVIAFVCARFGSSYKTLQPRVTRTLVSALLDPTRPLTTHYGAAVGLSSLGPHVSHLLLIPNIPAYMRLLEPELKPEVKPLKRFEAFKVYGALVHAAGMYIQRYSSMFQTPLNVTVARSTTTPKKTPPTQSESSTSHLSPTAPLPPSDPLKPVSVSVKALVTSSASSSLSQSAAAAANKDKLLLLDMAVPFSELWDLFGEAVNALYCAL